MLKKLFVVLAVLCSGALVFAAWEAMLFFNRASGEVGRDVFFEVRQGESIRSVAQRLEQEGLTGSAFRFWLFMRLSGKTVRMGEYSLKGSMLPADILNHLASGRSYLHTLTVQEGLNIYEIAGLYEAKGFGTRDEFLKWCRDRDFIREVLGEDLPSLEGYLFPETYSLSKNTGPKKLIQNMVEQFKSVYGQVQADNRVGFNRHEAVIMASIIEKETGAPEERPVISSVYHNRLRKPMRLHADPTVLYGIWVDTGEYKYNLTRKDLRTPNSYNTYMKSGLPAGPIANPGKEALRAALQPAETPYFYFVSRNDGTHVFSVDYKSHQEAVRKYQLDRRQREGKSWRDLNKGGSARN